MAVLTSQVSEDHFGVRPMDPMRDLGGVADLIEEAFAEDLDQSGQNALQELRWLSRLKPILWWMIYSNPEHTDFLSGFVWEEDNKIVGNTTVNRTSAGSRRWLISNVAVSEKYRRRGIARGLMHTALELVNEYNGLSVSLQVRADNVAAHHLYETLGFNEISGTTHLWADSVPKQDGHPPLSRKLVFRNRRPSTTDTRSAYSLACAATPLYIQKEWPIRQNHFRLNSNEQIGNIFRKLWGGGSVAHWVVEDGQRFVALVDITPGTWRKKHKIDLIVHPDWRGILEKPLISRALAYLYRWQSRGIAIKHPAYHTEALEAYTALGLTQAQTLVWMKREM